MVVLVGSFVVGTLVLASASRLAPAEREVRRTRSSDEALALAEAGVTLARGELARDPAYAGCKDVPLGAGRFSVELAREGDAVTVTSRGTLDPSTRTRHPVTRVVEARLSLAAPGSPLVLSWKER
jgi:hypothetical protein